MDAVLPMRRRSYGSIRSPVVKRDIQSLVVLKGWLYKLEGGALKQWKRRWCVLADFCLFFYKSHNEDKVFSTVLLPSYKINPCISEDRISRKFAFKAEHQNMKTYYFAADSKESMKRWMNAMSLASIMQNFTKIERVESGLGSTSNEEEDSGFTSYQYRRFGELDPNPSYERSRSSDCLKQRSQSCSDGVEMHLNSDDKYPSYSGSSQQLHSHHSYMNTNQPHRQPLYANAPPKPRRLTHPDPYALPPGDQYGYSYEPNSAEYAYQDSPEFFGYSPAVQDDNRRVDAMPDLYRDMEYQYRHEANLPDDARVSYDESYQGMDNVESQMPSDYVKRPHSADFLEREAESYPPVQSQSSKFQPQRPKSSLEYCDRYWDSSKYTPEDYRDAVRSQADNLYAGSSRTQPSDDYSESLARHQDVDQLEYNPNFTAIDPETYYSHKEQKNLGTKSQPKHDQSYSVEQANYAAYGSTRKLHIPSNSNVKKKRAHEESMRRLLEWKQRMLQSPLTRRAAQYSSSSSEAGSPRRPPARPPLPSEYRTRVLRELETHEARLRKHRMHQNDVSDSCDNTPNLPATSSVRNHYYTDESMEQPTGVNRDRYDSNCNRNERNLTTSSGHADIAHNTRRDRGTSDPNVMYCVDSENNEILIYGDNYVTNVNEDVSYTSSNRNEDQAFYHCSSKEASETYVKSGLGSSQMASGEYKSRRHQRCSKDPSVVISQQNLNSSYSSDDEASVDANHRYRHNRASSGKSRVVLNKAKNMSDSEIHVHEPSQLRKLVQLSEGVMNKGKRLSVSAGDLLGKTHEELVLLLIQLRRNQSRIMRAKEKCLQQLEYIDSSSSSVNENRQQSYTHSRRELMEQVTLLEKQYEVGRPLVNLVDNMVKLGSLYGNNDKRSSSAPYLSLPETDVQEPPPCSSSTSPGLRRWSSNDDEAQSHLSGMYQLDKGIAQEAHSYNSLQQDKEMLEHTLHGMKSKILDHQDKPIELQKLRKQQRLIEKELTRVKRLLNHSAKKIEDATTKNDQLEQEILLLRQKLQQALQTGSENKSHQSRADLEAELNRMQNVLEELASYRQEINNTVETLKNDSKSNTCRGFSSKVRASPTGVAGSAPLPRKKQQTTYLETDLDTMVTCDLSTISRDFDDIPLYANAEEISCEAAMNEVGSDANIKPSSAASNEKENVPQCSLQDINEADDKMKRFYGILPREKACEIKTVRIVKRQSERRSRERDKKSVTYGDKSSVWVVDEPDFSSDDHIETDEETFKKVPSVSYPRPTSIPLPIPGSHRQMGIQSAHERLFGNNSAPQNNEQQQRQQAPVSHKLTGGNLRSHRRSKRRHYTVSGCQYLAEPQFPEFKIDGPRSRDDVDMERCLRTANTPDIVRSTIKKKEVYDDKVIEREIGLPEKISIPERYIEDEPEMLSASERLRRNLKAENIRKMLSETTASYENVANAADGRPEAVHKKFSEQKQKRAHLLALNHALAQEVMERSKAVAANIYCSDSEPNQ